MGSLSSYLENKVLDHLFGRTTYTAPSTLYVGLWSVPLSGSATGSTAGEIAGSNYARQAVVNNTSNWPAASGGTKSNSGDVAFGQAATAWGAVKAAAILDAAAAGNILVFTNYSPAVYVDIYDPVTFIAGNLTISID